jgi:hypothetical protein
MVYSFDFDPHAVIFSDFETISGVRLATRWTFFKWDSKAGVVGDPVGRATLRNIEFVHADESIFARPSFAREDPPPAPSKPAGRDRSRLARPLENEPRQ